MLNLCHDVPHYAPDTFPVIVISRFPFNVESLHMKEHLLRKTNKQKSAHIIMQIIIHDETVVYAVKNHFTASVT